MVAKPRKRIPSPKTPPSISGAPDLVHVEVTPPPAPSKSKWEGLSEEQKLKVALHHFGIKRADVLSYRVYPHKVAIVFGFGQKVEYWPGG